MYLLLLTTLLFAAHGVFVSCDDNEDFTTSPSAKLTFPADTLRLDTALTVVSSPTYSFTVHNRTSKGIRITNVALANPESSGFRVNVDGTFINEDYDYAIEVRSHDSIAVWVDITPRFQDSDDPVLVTDRLMFTLESGVVQTRSGWQKARLLPYRRVCGCCLLQRRECLLKVRLWPVVSAIRSYCFAAVVWIICLTGSLTTAFPVSGAG